MNTRDEFLKRIEWERNYLNESAAEGEAALMLVPQSVLEHVVKVGATIDHSPYLTVPYDRNLRTRIVCEMQEAGWHIEYEMTEKEVHSTWNDPHISFEILVNGSRFRTIVEFGTGVEGSKCKKVKVGQRQKTEDVFDFTCGE